LKEAATHGRVSSQSSLWADRVRSESMRAPNSLTDEKEEIGTP